jgi:hypothetical protein
MALVGWEILGMWRFGTHWNMFFGVERKGCGVMGIEGCRNAAGNRGLFEALPGTLQL